MPRPQAEHSANTFSNGLLGLNGLWHAAFTLVSRHSGRGRLPARGGYPIPRANELTFRSHVSRRAQVEPLTSFSKHLELNEVPRQVAHEAPCFCQAPGRQLVSRKTTTSTQSRKQENAKAREEHLRIEAQDHWASLVVTELGDRI